MAKVLSKVKLYIGNTTPPPTPPSSDAFTLVGNVVNLDGPGLSKDQIEHTDMDSTAREYFGSLPDGGELSGTLRRNFGDAGQALVRGNALAAGGTQRAFKIERISATGAVLETVTFAAEVLQWSESAQNQAPFDISFSIKITGSPTYV